jgi:hypothetical protein
MENTAVSQPGMRLTTMPRKKLNNGGWEWRYQRLRARSVRSRAGSMKCMYQGNVDASNRTPAR